MKIAKNRRIAGTVTVLFVSSLLASGVACAQATTGRAVSIGGVLGDPLGATMRYPLGMSEAVDVGFGPDYFGSPRLQLDYVWQFHAFGSKIIGEYAGPGLAVAFAKGINSFYTREPHRESFASKEDNRFDIGGRAIIGISITPKASRVEFFVESGPLIPAGRIFDVDVDGAVGFRYKL
ncbi:MAG TPA: hypothetical protein PL001_00920 [Candidatus Kryptobacter bacterium]|nr:hypothetical protein [Candidatus Kryptobacter bacterium]